MSDRPLITLLSPDLGSNLMIRAYELIELLRRDFRLHIVGRGSPDALWAPLAKAVDVECRSFDASWATLARRSRSICRELIEGDLILSLGVRPESYGLGLVARRTLRRPLVLDNHEWESGYLPPLRQVLRRDGRRLVSKLVYRAAQRFLDGSCRRADAMFVTNTFLERRYGGYWLPHVRDEQTFRPPTDCRRSLGEGPTVMFLGTARPYKGLADLLTAWAAVDVPGARLRIVGTVRRDHPKRLVRQADDRVSFEPPVGLERVPSTLAEADIVVIPQRAERQTIGQLPSKLVEAMAMGRAIVATAVGDAPLWLAEGAGIIVSPGEPDELARSITALATDRDRRVELGRRARERFLLLGSMRAHRERVVDLLRSVIEKRGLPRVWPSISAATGSPG